MDAMSIITSVYDHINDMEVNTAGSCYKLLLSLMLGAAIGFARKRKGRSAGVRTF